MARKSINVFSLSFLDAMTCGLGAVILLFMIINANIDVRRDVVLDELAGEVDRMELQVLVGRKNLVQLQQQLAELIPLRHALEGVRLALLTGASLFDLKRSVAFLVVFSAVLLPTSLKTFRLAVNRAKADGSLGQY